MKKNVSVNFFISQALSGKVDAALDTWGFGSRAEFFRFCAIEFLRFDAQTILPDATVKEYSKAVQSVKASKWLAKKHFLRKI